MFEGLIQSLSSIASKLTTPVPVVARLSFTPTIANFACSSKVCRYRQIGSEIDANYQFMLSGTPTGTITITLPVQVANQGCDYLGQVWVVRQGVGYYLGTALVSANGTTAIIYSNGSAANWNGTTPAVLQNGDVLIVQIRYEGKV